jgi:hypothetical protein
VHFLEIYPGFWPLKHTPRKLEVCFQGTAPSSVARTQTRGVFSRNCTEQRGQNTNNTFYNTNE